MACACCTGGIPCVFCTKNIPVALTATFANDGTNDAACWNGQKVPLTLCTADNVTVPPCADCGEISNPPTEVIWEGLGSAPCPIAQRPIAVTCDADGIIVVNGCRGTEFDGTQTFLNCNAGAFLWQGIFTSLNDGSTVSLSIAAS